MPLGINRVEETKGLIDESHGDCWVARSCNVDGHNGALKVLMCIQCHITPMGSYMLDLDQSKDLMGTDRTHGVTQLIGCPSS